MINYWLIIIALCAGFLTKFVDLEEHGLRMRKLVFYSAAFLYGFLIAYAVRLEPVVAPLAFGTIMGLVLTKKIDSKPHLVGVGSFVIFIAVLGFPGINLVFLTVLVTGSFLDEIVNSFVLDKGRAKNYYLKKFLETRPFLEITAFILAAATGLWPLWYTLLFYDIGYILTTRSSLKLMK